MWLIWFLPLLHGQRSRSCLHEINSVSYPAPVSSLSDKWEWRWIQCLISKVISELSSGQKPCDCFYSSGLAFKTLASSDWLSCGSSPQNTRRTFLYLVLIGSLLLAEIYTYKYILFIWKCIWFKRKSLSEILWGAFSSCRWWKSRFHSTLKRFQSQA